MKIVERETARRGIPYEIIHTNPEGKYFLFESKIADEHFTDVVIIGGDGTVNQVINALKHTGITFGIIPSGSGNGLAYAADIPKSLKKALELVFNGKSKLTDGFLINGKFSCMLSGLGFDAEVAQEFATKATRGLMMYTQQSIIQFFKAHPYQFEIMVDGFSFYTDAFFISIANSNQFGNNFTIAPEAKLDDGLLDIVIVQKMKKATLPFAILKQIRGNNKLQQIVQDVQKKNVLYFQTPSLQIKNPMLAPLHIDGEPESTSELFNVEIWRNAFKLIRD